MTEDIRVLLLLLVTLQINTSIWNTSEMLSVSTSNGVAKSANCGLRLLNFGKHQSNSASNHEMTSA